VEVRGDAAAALAEDASPWASSMYTIAPNSSASFAMSPTGRCPRPSRDTVADHEELLELRIRLPQRALQVRDVVVLVDEPLRLREPDAVDDGPVVELVVNSASPSPRAGGWPEFPRTRSHSRARLASLELRNTPLELLVEVHVPRDRRTLPLPARGS